MGNKKFEEEDWINAKFYFDALVKSDPRNINFLERRGYCNYGLKRYKQALLDFDSAINASQIENSPQLLFFRGNTYYKLNNFNSAIEDFNSMLEIQPTQLNATNQRGLSFAKIGKIKEACSDFNRVYKNGIKSLRDKAKINIDKYCK